MKKYETISSGVAASSTHDALVMENLPLDKANDECSLQAGDKSILGVRAAEFNYRLLSNEGRVLHVRMANTWYSRLRGLLGRPALQSSEALVLKPCSAVHGFGLKYKIDVAFIDRSGLILRCAELKQNSLIASWRAHAVVEMANGTIERLGLKQGQQLTIEKQVSL